MKSKVKTLFPSIVYALGLSSLTMTTSAFAEKAPNPQDRFANVTITSTQLTSTAYMFSGAGGNIGVSAGKDGILIIDDQFAPLASKIEQALTAIKPEQPKYIINTHYHGDHTGGNQHFGDHGTIMAHHNVLKRLKSNSKTPDSALPVITYDEGIAIHFNDVTLKVIHMGAGHTDGDSIILWNDLTVLHMGDLFFKDRFPYIDLKAGGSVLGYRDSVVNALELITDETKVIPGHGGLANKQDLLRFKQMLDASIEWMQEQKANKTSLESMKTKGLPSQWENWSWQFISQDKWIETLYHGI